MFVNDKKVKPIDFCFATPGMLGYEDPDLNNITIDKDYYGEKDIIIKTEDGKEHTIQARWSRIPALFSVRNNSDIPISVDTTKASIIKEALKFDVQIINDISSLGDSDSLNILRDKEVYICLMHMKGTPNNMQDNPEYDNVVLEVLGFLKDKINMCIKAGISKEKLIIDPGFGFGKTLDHNYELLKNLKKLKHLHKNLLVGISRKSMIGNLLNREIDQRLIGSLAATLISVYNGANIIRTHDVHETKLLLNMTQALKDWINEIIWHRWN